MCPTPLQTFPGSFHWCCRLDFKAFRFWLYILMFTSRYHLGQAGPLVTRSRLVLLHFSFPLLFFPLRLLLIYIRIWLPNSYFQIQLKDCVSILTVLNSQDRQWFLPFLHSTLICLTFRFPNVCHLILKLCVIRTYLNYYIGSKSCSVWISHILDTIPYTYLTLNNYLLNKIFSSLFQYSVCN